MKKILLLTFIYLFFSQVSADDWRAKKGSVINDEFKVNDKMILPLDKGEWSVVDRFSDTVTHGIGVEGVTFVQMEGNTPVRIFEIARATGLSKWQSYLTSIIEAATFNSKEEGCRKRQHYNYLNFYKRGSAHNCMYVSILDVQRSLNPSDYDADRVFSLGIRKWAEKNDINLPKIYLSYNSSFFSTRVRDQWYVVMYAVTPEKFANYKPKFTSRDTTEFHPDLIENFPKAKNIMNNWIRRSAELHYEFELFQKVKKSQKLDLSKFIVDTKKNVRPNPKVSNDIANQLKTLHDLYKSGALSGYEYEIAKKKILNK